MQNLIKPATLIPAGTYNFQSAPGAALPLRLHLRVDEKGEGVLIVNASIVLHLNQTAAEMAFYMIKQVPGDEIGDNMSIRYHVSAVDARRDYREFKHKVEALVKTPDLDPVGFMGFERTELYSSAVIAPYRLDCALTYQLADHEKPELAPVDRVKRELTTQEWQTILEKAWKAGVPHVLFTGGEPTQRPDLPDLIALTEKIGMVCGLLTDGLRLADPHYLQQVLNSGLDYLMLILDPAEEQSWHALRDILAEDISVTVHLTVTPDNASGMGMLLSSLAEMGVRRLSLSASQPDLKDSLAAIAQRAAEKGLSPVWDLPVPYSAFHPVALELVAGELVQGAGRAWLYVEPDGDVLPGQGINQVMGNLLNDPWDVIWAKRPQSAAPAVPA